MPARWALESDFSVFHRVDDMYQLAAALFLRRVAMISAYGGAFALLAQQRSTPPPAAPTAPAMPDYASMALNPDTDNTPDFEVQARFRKVLAETYPEHYADGGIKDVTRSQLEGMVN